MKQEPDLRFRPSREQLDEWSQWAKYWPDSLHNARDLDTVMKLLACLVDEYEQKTMDRIPCMIYRLALDWLATMRSQLNAFKAVAYTSSLCDSDGKPVENTASERYMLYNTHTIGDREAEELLQQGRQDTDPRVVDLWPQQAFALFPGLMPDPGEPETKG